MSPETLEKSTQTEKRRQKQEESSTGRQQREGRNEACEQKYSEEKQETKGYVESRRHGQTKVMGGLISAMEVHYCASAATAGANGSAYDARRV